MILGSLWNALHPPPRDQFATADESDGNLVKRLVTKSGIRIHIVDTPGKESISFATPRSNHLLLSEQVAETSRPAIALDTLGDIVFRAAGRIHRRSASHSVHVDGKEKKGATVSIADIFGNTKAFETVEIEATLTDGSTFRGPVGGGQSWHGLQPGSNSFSAPSFYNKKPESHDEAD